MANAEWISLGVLVVSVLVALAGYLRNPSLIPAARAADLRQQIEDLRTDNLTCRAEAARLSARVTYLEGQVEMLRSEAHWWQEQFRQLKDQAAQSRRRSWPEQDPQP